MEQMNAKELYEKLSYTKKNVFVEADAKEIEAIYEYSRGYMRYLDDAKTERDAFYSKLLAFAHSAKDGMSVFLNI